MRSKMQVFISVQWALNEKQQLLLNAVEMHLKQLSLSSIRIEKNSSNIFDDPFPKIRRTLSNCHGAIVIAFERLCCVSGIEYLGKDLISFDDRRSSSLWNHIEAAMAYQAGLPVLILQEVSLRQEGIIDKQLTSVKIIGFCVDDII